MDVKLFQRIQYLGISSQRVKQKCFNLKVEKDASCKKLV